MKKYLINSMENMRDIGGCITAYGKMPYQKIIRSNLPQNLSLEDLSFLKKIKITTVIDFRSELEYSKKISSFEGNKNFNLFHCPFVVGRDIPSTPQDVPLSYLQILEDKQNVLNILNIIADAEDGVLYFCNAGKDRTGVITALLMLFLGVNYEDIITDYLLTKEYLADMLAKFIEISEKDISKIIIPHAEFIQEFIDGFIGKYKSVSNYMKMIGFSDDMQLKLKNKLIYNGSSST